MKWALFLVIIEQNGIHAEELARYSTKEICFNMKTELSEARISQPSWTYPQERYRCVPVPLKN